MDSRALVILGIPLACCDSRCVTSTSAGRVRDVQSRTREVDTADRLTCPGEHEEQHDVVSAGALALDALQTRHSQGDTLLAFTNMTKPSTLPLHSA